MALWGRVIKSPAMKISLNGETRQFSSPLTVAALVEALGYAVAMPRLSGSRSSSLTTGLIGA